MSKLMAVQLDVGRIIDERPMSGLQLRVAILCALSVALDGYGLQVMALAVPSLAQEWGIAPSSFGLALAAAVIGLSLGGAFFAPLGDRFGRRTVVIGGMLLIGLASLLTATAGSPGQFVVWRLLTGIGLGICVPNCNAWTAEYAPVRRRSLVVVMVNAAIGVGAFSAGFIAPPMIAAWGWRGPFLLGGVLAVIVALLLYFTAPESLKFMVVRRPDDRRIAAILRRIAPDVDAAYVHVATSAVTLRRSVFELLGPGFRARTLVLWLIFALNLFTLYLLVSWLPTLLHMAGWPSTDALQAAVLIQAGGVVGGIVLSQFLDRGLALPALRTCFLLAAVCLGLFLVVPSGPGWIALLFLIGIGISGSQLSLNALATAYYPSAIKATGMGWAGVMGGWGAMLGPMAGAWLVGLGLPAVTILTLLAVPALLSTAGVWLMRHEWQAH
ncbi:MFS transporter [Massilia niastensis]|uniref:MFS transporter n=1 Tax=Massilia niastensis TaxID=544911 RepID=UPI0003653C72|nr:MFS transporter [Massilia niastensis]